MIVALKKNEIFVFGSNTAGRHGAGAALQAKMHFGAQYGVGEGFTGMCYAIPTLDSNFRKRTHEDLKRSVDTFLQVARDTPKLTFLVTKIGCGLAGYSEWYIQGLFRDIPANVILPEGW